jgi:site-specific DNA recombinase
MTYIRNPETGRRVSRMNAPLQSIAMEIPELRIIEQELWDQVQARLASIRTESGADDPNRPRFWEARRPCHVLTGKVFCGCCNGLMANIGRDYLACSVARRQGMCSNRRGILRIPSQGGQ